MRLKLPFATLALGAALALAGAATPFAALTSLAAPVTAAFDNPAPMPIPDGEGAVESPIAVAGLNGPITKIRVSVHLIHPLPDDLLLTLIGPDGTQMILSEENGAAYDNDEPGENYGTAAEPVAARTIFDDDALEYIYDGGAPFTGSFKPEEFTFAETFGGKAANGTWILRVEDLYEEDTGTLQVWGIEITSDVP